MRNCLLSLDLGGTFLTGCLFDPEGVPLPGTFDREPVDSNGELQTIRNAYQAFLRRLKNRADEACLSISEVVAGIPGPFDFRNGVSRMEHKYASLFGVPLRPWFEEVLGEVPLRFLHDSTAFLSGAVLAHPDIRNAAAVMIGTGLGFAVMEDGTVLQNENGGPAYSIYKKPFRGKTAEDFLSGRAIVSRYRALSARSENSAKTVGDLADSGIDPAAVLVYEELGSNLAAVIRPILSDLKTEALYLGGQISKSFPVFEPKLREGLSDLPSLRIIEAAKDPDLVPLKGAVKWNLSKKPEQTTGGKE
ncbi:MAG: ROK family protein [Candidatus Methanomethylophilaceae archaeon]|nr:ROK family protein [Candidatus Methanomethylophilaceae archaeon]